MPNNATALSQQEFDLRDYMVNNAIKDIPDIAPPFFMHTLSKTYKQENWECTAFGTMHSSLIQNEQEHWPVIDMLPELLRSDMGHKPTDKWGDSVENAVKTAIKMWIKGRLNNEPYIFKSDGYAYGKRDSRKEVCTKKPLITIVKWSKTTWFEMLWWEVKTLIPKIKQTEWHCVVIGGYDAEYCYFYNSFVHNLNSNTSKFKIKREFMAKMIENGMLNRRYFVLFDSKDLQDYAVEKELSKQIIKLAKKLHSISDPKVKEYLERIQITDFLEKTYWFKYE